MLKHFFPIMAFVQVIALCFISYGGLASSKSAVVYGLFGFVISFLLMAFVASFGDRK